MLALDNHIQFVFHSDNTEPQTATLGRQEGEGRAANISNENGFYFPSVLCIKKYSIYNNVCRKIFSLYDIFSGYQIIHVFCDWKASAVPDTDVFI